MSVRLKKQRPSWKKSRTGLTVELAATEQEVQESQRLRYQLFSENFGEQFADKNSALDRDYFDPYCHHLLVRDYYKGTVVGSTRILTNSQAYHAGGFYSEDKFDLGDILRLRGKIMEVGRTCIHPDYLNSGAMLILWAGLSRLIDIHQIDYMMGCVSIPLLNGHRSAQAVIQYLRERYPAPAHLHIEPHRPFQLDDTISADKRPLPFMLETYLHLGAHVWGEACLDSNLDAVNLFFLLEAANLNQSYRSHGMERKLGSAVEGGGVGPVYL